MLADALDRNFDPKLAQEVLSKYWYMLVVLRSVSVSSTYGIRYKIFPLATLGGNRFCPN